jgi:RNA polymerase sigma-70 factor (ECF subfamily)
MTGLAYRMLGSRAEAEDVVQDAWLRWRKVDAATVEEPGAYLNRVVTRLALDRLKSARARREVYVGEWLPEPVVEPDFEAGGDADLSVAFLLALERLTPLERAAFLLHDVFDTPSPRSPPPWAAARRPAASWRRGPASTSATIGRATSPRSTRSAS